MGESLRIQKPRRKLGKEAISMQWQKEKEECLQVQLARKTRNSSGRCWCRKKVASTREESVAVVNLVTASLFPCVGKVQSADAR